MEYKLNLRVLKKAMLNKGYSINKLSRACGVGKATISRALNELTLTREDTIYKIAIALDLKSEDIVEEE